MDDLFIVKFLAGLSKLTKISPSQKCSFMEKPQILDKYGKSLPKCIHTLP